MVVNISILLSNINVHTDYTQLVFTYEVEWGIDGVLVVVYVEEALDGSESDSECDENRNEHWRLGKPAETSEQLVTIAGAPVNIVTSISSVVATFQVKSNFFIT